MALLGNLRNAEDKPTFTKSLTAKNGALTLTIHDTDFLMKMFLRSSIQGNEIDQAHKVFSKLKNLHKGNIEDES